MKAIGRFFIVIWTIIFIALWFCGGGLLFPLGAYIFTGNCIDPFESSWNIWENVVKLIDKFFTKLSDGVHISNVKFEGGFWK